MIVVAEDGVRLQVAGYGEGWRHLLLIPDWLSSSTFFEGLIEPLVHRGARVALYDPRGTGHSDRPLAGYSVVREAEDAALVLEALTMRPAWVVGHGYGAHVALKLARIHPELVAGILLLMPAYSLGANRVTPWRDAVEDVRRLADVIASSSVGPLAPDRLTIQARDMAKTTRAAGLARLDVLAAPLDLPALTVPAKVLAAELDDWTPLGTARRALADWARIFHVWPGAGHYGVLEDPDHAVDLMLETLDQEPAPESPETAETAGPDDGPAGERSLGDEENASGAAEAIRSPWGPPLRQTLPKSR